MTERGEGSGAGGQRGRGGADTRHESRSGEVKMRRHASKRLRELLHTSLRTGEEEVKGSKMSKKRSRWGRWRWWGGRSTEIPEVFLHLQEAEEREGRRRLSAERGV